MSPQELDTFAVALVAYILLTGDHPFAGAGSDPNLSKVCRKIEEFSVGQLRLKYADWCWKGSAEKVSPAARDFIERIGNEFPDRRLSVKDALEHPFITRRITMSITAKVGLESSVAEFEAGQPKLESKVSENLLEVAPETPLLKNNHTAEASTTDNDRSDSLPSYSNGKLSKAIPGNSKVANCDNMIDEEEEVEEDLFSSPNRGICQMMKFLL